MAEAKKPAAADNKRKKVRPTGPFYPKGTPVDENGNALEGAVLSRDEALAIGALDPDSARATQLHYNIMEAKKRGELVAWHPDSRIALQEIYEVYPQAEIYVRRVLPEPDDNIPSRPLSFIKDYDGLRRFISDVHWRGNVTATYEWVARAVGYPRIGVGTIVLAKIEEDVMRQNGNGSNGHGYPPAGYPPQQQQYGGYPPVGYPPAGYPPPQQLYPAPGYAYPPPGFQPPSYAQPAYPPQPQPQAQQQPQPQPQPVPPQPQPQPQLVQQLGPPQPSQMFPVIGPDGQSGWLINGVFYAANPQHAQQVPQAVPPPPTPAAPAPAPAPQAQPGQDFQSFLVMKMLEMAQQQNASFMEQMKHTYERQQAAPQPQYPYPGYPGHPYPGYPSPQLPMYPGLTPVSYGLPPGFVVAPQQQPAAAPATPEKPVEPPPSPFQVMQQAFSQTASVMKAQKEFTDQVKSIAGVSDEVPEPPAPVIQPPDDFALRTKEVNGVTVGEVDGELMGLGETALLNAPKLVGMFGGFVDKMIDRFDKVKNEKKGDEDATIARRREEVELEERAVAARKEAEESKIRLETAKLQVRAGHAQIDAFEQQRQNAAPPPPPVPPPTPHAAPPVPPPAPQYVAPPPPPPVYVEAPEPEPEPVEAPENAPVPPPPSAALD